MGGTIDWSSDDRADLDGVAREVLRWIDYVPDSPLYRTLAHGIAEDEELLRVVAAIDNVPPLNLLFAAVKLTLEPADALAAWYPHLTARPRDPGPDAVAAFREHVLAHHEPLLALAGSRRTQTNETGRAAVLLPWIPTGAPVHAIDVGASAGLNLCLDRFTYEYGGDADARLGTSGPTLRCEVRGDLAPPERLPMFASRTGIDLSPVDATDPDEAAWLEALVWPEHTDRLERLRAAIAVRREVPVRMIAGDAATALADAVDALPPGPLVAWHTIALYQAPAEVQRDFDAALAGAARDRDVTRIGFEPEREAPHPVVRVSDASGPARRVAQAHAHGRWIEPAPE